MWFRFGGADIETTSIFIYPTMCKNLLPVSRVMELIVKLAPEFYFEVVGRDKAQEVGIKSHLIARDGIQERLNSLVEEIQNHGKVDNDGTTKTFGIM